MVHLDRQVVLRKWVDTGNAEYESKKIFWADVTQRHIWSEIKLGVSGSGYILVSIYDVLFGPSNFREIMRDHCYLHDYLPAQIVSNELNIPICLGYKACCVVSNNKLEILQSVIK